MAQYDLKRLRKEKGLTQQELAKSLNLSQGHLSTIESGRNPFPDERVDDLQALFPDLQLEDYENVKVSKETNIQIGTNNKSSDVRINQSDSTDKLMSMLQTQIEDKNKEREEWVHELEYIRTLNEMFKEQNDKLDHRNEKLAERYDRVVDELETTRKKLFEAREEIWALKTQLAELGKK